MKVISLAFAKKWREKHGDKPIPTLAELAREVRLREEAIRLQRVALNNLVSSAPICQNAFTPPFVYEWIQVLRSVL